VIDTAELLVSELVSNAIRHTRARSVRIALARYGPRIRVGVEDPYGHLVGPPPPVPSQNFQALLARADERDRLADERDRRAEERDEAADRRPFTSQAEYAAAAASDRGMSAVDRYESGVDRDLSAGDRADLTALPPGRLRRQIPRQRQGWPGRLLLTIGLASLCVVGLITLWLG
jgi:hypothetical protein